MYVYKSDRTKTILLSTPEQDSHNFIKWIYQRFADYLLYVVLKTKIIIKYIRSIVNIYVCSQWRFLRFNLTFSNSFDSDRHPAKQTGSNLDQ